MVEYIVRSYKCTAYSMSLGTQLYNHCLQGMRLGTLSRRQSTGATVVFLMNSMWFLYIQQQEKLFRNIHFDASSTLQTRCDSQCYGKSNRNFKQYFDLHSLSLTLKNCISPFISLGLLICFHLFPVSLSPSVVLLVVSL